MDKLMPWYTKSYGVDCAICNHKKATVMVFDEFNCAYGPYCSSCGKAKVIKENKARDRYNKFYREQEKE